MNFITSVISMFSFSRKNNKPVEPEKLEDKVADKVEDKVVEKVEDKPVEILSRETERTLVICTGPQCRNKVFVPSPIPKRPLCIECIEKLY